MGHFYMHIIFAVVSMGTSWRVEMTGEKMVRRVEDEQEAASAKEREVAGNKALIDGGLGG
jgi:hypothetical protein